MSKQRPHVLYVAEFSTGGSIESLLTLVGGLDKTAFRATILFYKMPDLRICERVERAGAEIKSIYPRSSDRATSGELKKRNLQAKVRRLFGRRVEYAYQSLKYGLEYARFRLPTYRAILEQLQAIQPDIVHFNAEVVSDTPGIQAARAFGVPSISHVRVFGDVTYLSVLICSRVSAFICISAAVRDYLVDRGIDEERCIVIANAVDLARFNEIETTPAAIREEFGWDDTDKVIALVGRIVDWKGQDFFIRAIADARKTDASIRGLIVGDDSGSGRTADYIAGLRSLIEELDLGDSLRFSGHRTDVPNIMKSADAVICASSKPEPFGRVIIESMAVGTPVIATDAGGAAEIIENDINGMLVPIRNSDAMAAAVLRLTSDEALAESIRSAGLRSVTDHYTVATHVGRISEIYQEILGAQPK